MRNGIRFSITVLAAMLASLGSAIGKPINGGCNYPTHKMIVEALRPGVSLVQAIHHLRGKRIRFGLYAEDDQKVDISALLRGKNIRPLGNPAIVVTTKNPKNRGLITGGELLDMKFDKQLRLVNVECEKYYTGP